MGLQYRYNETRWLDSAGFGIFLLASAWILLKYPFFWNSFTAWLSSLPRGWVAPPLIIIEPIAVFFVIMGVWSIAEGIIRGLAGGSARQSVSNIVGGCFNFVIAYILRGYEAGSVSLNVVIPTIIIFFGVSLIISGIVSGLKLAKY